MANFRRLVCFSYNLLKSRYCVVTGHSPNVPFLRPITSSRLYSRDILAPTLGIFENDLRMLRATNNENEVFHFVRNHIDQMQGEHIVESLNILFTLQKRRSSRQSPNEIIKNEDFVRLCKGLNKQIRNLELNKVIVCLKILAYLQVPTSSVIMQSLLQMIRSEVNQLTLQHITFLNFLLKEIQPTPLSNALKIALPMVFETQLKFHLDKNNPSQLADLLYYCSREKVSNKCLDVIIKALIEMNPLDWKVLNSKKVTSIIWSLCELKHTTQDHVTLYNIAIQQILCDISSYTFEDLHVLVRWIPKKAKIAPNFYNEDFLDAVGSLLIAKDMSFDECSTFLRRFNAMRHIHIPLLEHLSVKVAEDQKVLSNNAITRAIIFFDALSEADYKTDNWEAIRDAISTNQNILSETRINIPWAKFLLDLVALDIFIDPLLEKIFSEQFLKDFMNREFNIIDYLQILSVYQAVKTRYKEYQGIFPPQSFLNKVINISGENEEPSPFQKPLEHGLGGEEFLLTRCFSRLGHYIDHAVVMSKDGCPIPFNKSADKNYIEDIACPPDCQVILIELTHRVNYAANIHRLRGYKALEYRTLESMGFPVVPVAIHKWKELQDFEKIPYLMRSIKDKLDTRHEQVSCSSS